MPASDLREDLPDLPHGRAVVFGAFGEGVRPPPNLGVDDWAEQKRFVSAESGSPFAGKWENDRTPYLIEPMQCMGESDPARDVTFMKSHQVGGTEAYINVFGYVVEWHPTSMLIVLASLDEASKFVKIKLQPTIDETPSLKHRVKEQRSRSEDGSTTTFKKFRRGFCQVTGANSAKGLQMISVKYLLCDEITDWPADVDNRGDPLTLAEKRTSAHMDTCKRFFTGTPGIKSMCRITTKFEKSDQRRFYVPCPHCGDFQVLKFERLKYDSNASPYNRGVHFVCASHGCVIEPHHRKAMIKAGVWLKTYEDKDKAANPTPPDAVSPEELALWRERSSMGRQPGFHLWQAYSAFVAWEEIVEEWVGVQEKPDQLQVFVQQVLGEAWEETGEAPDYEKLLLNRESYALGTLPPGAMVITGMADVQVNRIEWGVYAWGVGMSGWLIDKGVIEGDPESQRPWSELQEIIGRTYPNALGNPWPIEAFGVDSGYLSNMVYQFARLNERVFALDGRGAPLHPFIGTPTKVDVNWRGKAVRGGAMLWPTGTFKLKIALYGGLRRTIEGVNENGEWALGAQHFPMECDEEFFKQLTAESLKKQEKRDGSIFRQWVKRAGQANEQLDIWVGARAMASHLGLDRLDRDGWQTLAQQREVPPEIAQRELSELWSTPVQQEKPAGDAPAKESALARLARLNRTD